LGKSITILGSTGSIGTQALTVASMLDMDVYALSAGRNIDLLYSQVCRYRPRFVVIADKDAFSRFRRYDLPGTQVLYGDEGLKTICLEKVGIVLNSIVGIAGLKPTLDAIDSGNTLALANKESIVTFGGHIMKNAEKKNVQVIPVDSEHSAVFQCLKGEKAANVRNIILTASGGPFIDKKAEELKKVTVAQALDHPNWKMGKKITIDSATMMNKGLEVMEARYLFDIEKEKIKVIIQRESIIHSIVEFIDSSYIAQMGHPDMKIPITYAVTYPERVNTGVEPLDLGKLGMLRFEDADRARFPCLQLAYESLAHKNSMNVVLNAANEVSVEAFLNEKIGFTDIARTIENIMEKHTDRELDSCDEVLELDRDTRLRTAEYIGGYR
jgi:1-deoxy-D-xylulose-5-phosphate reductoisomerase